ncbi:hypothetical protein Mal15_60450 [Stieleria maiorica]|uniref:Uncharacterized protein n=1 Tax=Stieleria maiorica TaxID=2795974 RepID=A0A5B9MKV8_9BACT|nr:hypothetical protein [Stieleria maiorica]QEG01962.1 hypothetical protein Mal15_60450 [Stieleria maiorica]
MHNVSQAEGQSDRMISSKSTATGGEGSSPPQADLYRNSSPRSAIVTAFEASHQLRLVTRGMIAVLCVVAVFLFLFFPDHSGAVTFPIPMLVIAFAVLRAFARFTHLLIFRPGRSMRPRHSYRSVSLAVSASDFLIKATVAFLMATTIVIGSTYDFPHVGIVAALCLLVATLVNRPWGGLFPDASREEQRDRVRRQTRESLAQAALEAGIVPEVRPCQRDPQHGRDRQCFHDGHRGPIPAATSERNVTDAANATDEVYIEFDEVEEEDAFADAQAPSGFTADFPARLRVVADRVG